MPILGRVCVPDHVVLVREKFGQLECHHLWMSERDNRFCFLGDESVVGDTFEYGHPAFCWVELFRERCDDVMRGVPGVENLIVLDVAFDKVCVGDADPVAPATRIPVKKTATAVLKRRRFIRSSSAT